MKHLAKLGLAALFLAHSPAVTAQSPTAAPSIVDDDVDVIPKANGKATNIDVLANDTPATDGGALKITAVFTPTSRRRRHLEEQFNIAHAIEGADSLMGGHCVPSGNKLRIKYTAPSMDYSGPDSCEYEACDENDMCGTATIHMSVNSVDAPEINDDEVTEPVSGNTFVDVLANDKAADGGGELHVESIIPPKDLWMDIPGPDGGDSSPTLDDLQKLQQRRRNTRKLQHIDLVQEGAHSYAGGMCYPTGNRKRVRYDPPSTTYAGADMCEYEACDENNRCGTAMIYIRDVVPTETGAPTSSPGSKSRKQKPSRSSKGSKASSNVEKRNERKRMKKERKKMMHDEAQSEAGEGEESDKKKKKMHAEAEEMVAAEEESEKKGRKKAMHAEAESVAAVAEGGESGKKEHKKKKQKESEAADGRL